MASTTGTNGMSLGDIPLYTLMLDKAAVVSVVEAQAEATMSGVQDIVDTAVSTVWKAGGSKTAAQLTTSLLVAANEGYVYNLTTDATTTSGWAEGAGKTILAGTDVAVINTGTAAAPVYKFNALAARDASVVRSINGVLLPDDSGSVTIPTANYSGDGLMSSSDWNRLNSTIVKVVTDSGVQTADSSGAIDIHGEGGIVTRTSGSAIYISHPGAPSGFASVAVQGTSGSTSVTGTATAASATDTVTLKAGSNVSMSVSGKVVTINASSGAVATAVMERIKKTTVKNLIDAPASANMPSNAGYLTICGILNALYAGASETEA